MGLPLKRLLWSQIPREGMHDMSQGLEWGP